MLEADEWGNVLQCQVRVPVRRREPSTWSLADYRVASPADGGGGADFKGVRLFSLTLSLGHGRAPAAGSMSSQTGKVR